MTAIVPLKQRTSSATELPARREVPVSARIRSRLMQANRRFHANDNIAGFILPRLDELQHEVESRIRDVLESLIIDTERDHNTHDTARRVAKMYLSEVFRGRYLPQPAVTEFPNGEGLNELMIVGRCTARTTSFLRVHESRRVANTVDFAGSIYSTMNATQVDLTPEFSTR